jgi:hypothetical protein
VLSFIQMRARDKTSILNGLNELQLYAMSYPVGDDSDFNVARTPRQLDLSGSREPNFNVRTSVDPNDYAREFGFDVSVNGISSPQNPSPYHDIYVSFVAGPNASDPVPGAINRGLSLQPRKNQRGQVDTLFRTFSPAAMDDISVFRSMVMAALVSGLFGMFENGCTRVIMASPGSGLYAGPWRRAIQAGYYEMCRKALFEAWEQHGVIFETVIIPEFNKFP